MILDDDLTEEALDKLAVSGTGEERRAVAKHPNAHLKTLLYLARIGFAQDVDQNPLLILHVEGASYEAIDLLTEIAQQTDRQERLEELSMSSWYDVRFIVARNERSSETALGRLSKDETYEVRNGVAANKSTPTDILSILATDRRASVRLFVAKNLGKVSRDILVRLSEDDLNYVSQAAKNALAKLE